MAAAGDVMAAVPSTVPKCSFCKKPFPGPKKLLVMSDSRLQCLPCNRVAAGFFTPDLAANKPKDAKEDSRCP